MGRPDLIVLVGAFITIAGCSVFSGSSLDCNTVPGDQLSESEDSVPFHLYVSNQSFDIDTVDIQVYIDDRQVVCDTFRVEAQHTWVLFELMVDPGEHTIRAMGRGGDVELTEEVDIPGERWGLVQFWTEEGRTFFTYGMQDQPILFM